MFWREGKRMLKIVVCKNEFLEDVFCCFKRLVFKIGIFVEVRKCEFYEKLSVKCKKKFEVVRKCKF